MSYSQQHSFTACSTTVPTMHALLVFSPSSCLQTRTTTSCSPSNCSPAPSAGPVDVAVGASALAGASCVLTADLGELGSPPVIRDSLQRTMQSAVKLCQNGACTADLGESGSAKASIQAEGALHPLYSCSTPSVATPNHSP